ncbi:MAG: IS1634 family transposase [Candidatus Dormibacteraceae bacterium]
MQRLEAKTIHGHTYYYLSLWGWKNGKCRRLSQQYLGKPEDIAQAVQGPSRTPQYAVVLDWGLPQALWQEAGRAQIVTHVDQLCPKRAQGLSPGDYIRLAAINRACHPVSKQAMWDWVARTSLPRAWPEACAAQLTSQHFWDHMDRIPPQSAQAIWQQLCAAVLQREQIELSQVCYDGTNFYTFIDTFNLKCQVARRGKNKQGRANLRQVSYALFCTTDTHLPLFYDVYEGNRNDAKEFPLVLEKFQRWLKERTHSTGTGVPIKPTLIFDKGNNSADNFALIDTLELPYVGSVKLDEHPDLARVSNLDARWQPATEPGLEGTKSWRSQQVVYGKERTLVMTYNQNLFDSQWATVQNDLAQALSQLALVQRNLQDRAAGLIKGGTPPTVASVERKCEQTLHRQHLHQLVQTTVRLNPTGMPQLSYQVDCAAQQKLTDTYLGKTLLITGHQQWSDAQVIRAYRSQFVIEEMFHEMKDRHIGAWWPLHHWTDTKIQVHGLYCTLAVLLRALLWRRVRQAGLRLSMSGLLEKLAQIRQVINVYPAKRAGQPGVEQVVLTQRDEVQEKLIEILGLKSSV